jgi:hypothetical protein
MSVIVIARSEIITGSIAYCDVEVPNGVAEEYCPTIFRIVVAGCVGRKRTKTSGGITSAGCVALCVRMKS